MLINSLFANCFASGWILSETRLKNLSFHKSWHQISDFNEKTMGSNGIFIIFIDLLESFVFVQILYVLYCMVILYISVFCLRKKTAGSSLLLSQGLWVQVPAQGFESHSEFWLGSSPIQTRGNFRITSLLSGEVFIGVSIQTPVITLWELKQTLQFLLLETFSLTLQQPGADIWLVQWIQKPT